MPSLCVRRQTALASLFHKIFMKPEGFTKHKGTWNKTNENGFVYVVSFQNNRWNFGEDCNVAVNLSVFLPILQEDWQKAQQGKYVKEYNAEFPFRERLGSLAMGKNIWWKMSDEPNELCLLMKDLYEAYAVDWFKTYSSYESIIAWWKSLDKELQTAMGIGRTMAILFGKLGYKPEAKQLFEALIERYQYERPQSKLNLIMKAQEFGITLELDNDKHS
jgi:hypothetical protein